MKIEYSSNNSGGGWWLQDEHWKALEAAGWAVDWCANKKTGYFAGDERFLGALATSASVEAETPGDAMRAFEAITGQQVSDEGCNCCGAPHSFSWDGGYASGEGCLDHLYPDVDAPGTLREAYERARNS